MSFKESSEHEESRPFVRVAHRQTGIFPGSAFCFLTSIERFGDCLKLLRSLAGSKKPVGRLQNIFPDDQIG